MLRACHGAPRVAVLDQFEGWVAVAIQDGRRWRRDAVRLENWRDLMIDARVLRSW